MAMVFPGWPCCETPGAGQVSDRILGTTPEAPK